VLVNENVTEKTIEFKVEARVDSNHIPIFLRIKKKEEEETGQEKNRKKREWRKL